METIKEQQAFISTLEGRKLQFYMEEYAKKAQTINRSTHIAMLDLLNYKLLKLNDERYHWEQIEMNNTGQLENLKRQQNPVVVALDIVENLFVKKYPNDYALGELLPQWYNSLNIRM